MEATKNSWVVHCRKPKQLAEGVLPPVPKEAAAPKHSITSGERGIRVGVLPSVREELIREVSVIKEPGGVKP